MIFLTHLAFALLIFIGLMKAFPAISFPPSFLPVLLFSSVLPDIDIGTSFIGRYFKIVNFFLKHRGFVHSVPFMAICAFGTYAIWHNWFYVVALILGFSSHLLLDALNYSGIRPFWPSKIAIKGFLKSGGPFDMLIFALLAITCWFLAVHSF